MRWLVGSSGLTCPCCRIISAIFSLISFALGSALCVPTIQDPVFYTAYNRY